MAEGDTILRAARRIGAALEGQAVEVSAPNPRGRAAGVESLDGMRVERVDARGKHLLLGFGELTLHSHLGMSGSWHVYRHGASWRKSPGAAWAVLRGDDFEAVQFGGPTLRVLMQAAVEHGREDRVVYRRKGQPCPRCATPILSRGQGDANRTPYWCPGCQLPTPPP